MKQSYKCGIYSRKRTISLLAAIGALYAIMIFYGIYGYGKIIENKDKETALFYAVFMALCFLGMTAAVWSTHILSRLAMRCVISEDGIAVRRLFGSGIMLSWGSIACYGVAGNEVLYASMTVLYFSTDQEEYAPKNAKAALAINDKRVILEYRQALFDRLSELMPDDMTKRLKDFDFPGHGAHFRR